jgi:uncharacterized repeat protein (TIGR03803 family)
MASTSFGLLSKQPHRMGVRSWSLLGCGLALIAVLPLNRADAKSAETVLYSFCSQAHCTDGAKPSFGTLVKDQTGNLYGTTLNGGSYNDGTVFKLSPNGDETVLYSFCSQANCTDGYYPQYGVIMDKSGNLYGTTEVGGASNAGVVYEISPDGTETVLYSFTGGSDGSGPEGVIMDKAGNLYGTTFVGGTIQAGLCSNGCGVVYKLVPDGTKSTATVLYAFQGASDAHQPGANLIMDKAGNFYGTGNGGACTDRGTVWEVSPKKDGHWTGTVLHSFGCGTDGIAPLGGVIMDKAGNLYGTTPQGGNVSAQCVFGCGTVYEIVPNGAKSTETVLFDFDGKNGFTPNSGVIMDKAGNLFGATGHGGISCDCFGRGVVYKLAPDGTERVLYAFSDKEHTHDGANPEASLLRGEGGSLYGTNSNGGTYGEGTVFEVEK